jgi:hypothetical protein
MKTFGIQLQEGSTISNMTVASGTAFPDLPSEGELFYRTDGANEALYVYNGESWISVSGSGGGTATYTITGDVTGTINGGTDDLTLAAVGTSGSYGSASAVPVFSTDTKGRVTTATNTTIDIASTQVNDFTTAVEDILGLVNLKTFGTLTSSGSAATAWTAAMTSLSSAGGIVNPKGSSLDLSAVTIPNAITVLDVAGNRLISSNVGIGKSTQAGGGHLLVRDARATQATRVHIEPNGYVTGTASKLDLMLDPYDADGALGYRILNFFTKTYDAADAATTTGTNGIGVIGMKGVTNQFGVFPTMQFGFSDGAAGSATPLHLHYFDYSDSAWRTPMKGGWRTGMSITTGDYCLGSFHLYQAASTGTTGATLPSHATGTVNDGGVDWTFIRDYQAVSSHFRGVVMVGDRDDMPKFGLPNVRAQFSQDIALWNGKKVRFLDNTDASVWSIFTNGNTDDLYIETEDATKRLRLDATGQFIQIANLALASTGNSESSLTATPSIKGVRLLTFGNASATTVTSFANGISNQEFYVRSSNGQTTLSHNSSIRLLGGANYQMSVDEVLHFVMNTAGTVAVQVLSDRRATTLAGWGITDAQPLDADLTAIAALAGTSGLLKKTAADTWTLDTSTFLTTNETITISGDVSGSGTTAITATLPTVNTNVGTFGTATKVGQFTVDGKGRITAAQEVSISFPASVITDFTEATQDTVGAFLSGSNGVTVTYDDAGNTLTASLTNVGAAGTYGSASSVPVLTTDLTGRVTGVTNTTISIAETQITDGSVYPRISANETITGTWAFNNAVTGVTPTTASHFTTKGYVDNALAGLTWKHPARVATTGNISLTGTMTIDGVAVVNNDRVLVKSQTTATENGVYVVNSTGLWSRATDFDETSPIDEVNSAAVFVSFGSTLADTGWTQINAITTVGTDAMGFVQFSGAGSYTAGTGMTLVGNDFRVNTANVGRIVVNVDDIDLATVGTAVSDSFKRITTDNWGRVTATSAVTAADITTALGTALDSTYVNVTGDTMSGDLILDNAVYLRSKIAAGTSTRMVGINASDVMYVGSVDATISSMQFANNGTTMAMLSTTGLGIGMTAVNALDITKTQGASSKISLLNASTAAGADARLELKNSADTAGLILYGTGHTNVNNTTLFTTNSGNLTFQTGATEKMRIANAGQLLIGTTTAQSVAGGTRLVQIEGGSNVGLSLMRNTADANQPVLSLGKSRGTTAGAVTIVQADDALGSIKFAGADGVTNIGEAASITAFVDGTPGVADMPGRLVFATSADGTIAPVERMRISSTGAITMGLWTEQTFSQALVNADAVAGKRALLTLPAPVAGINYNAVVRVVMGRNVNDVSGVNHVAIEYHVSRSGDATGANAYFTVDRVIDNSNTSGIGTFTAIWYYDNTTGTPYLRFGHSANSVTYYVKVEANHSGVATLTLDAGTVPSGSVVPATFGISNASTVNTLALSTGGTERARIDSAGNLGVGGTAIANVRIQAITAGTASNSTIRVNNDTDTSYGQIQYIGSTFATGPTSRQNSLEILTGAATTPISLQINGTEKLRVEGAQTILQQVLGIPASFVFKGDHSSAASKIGAITMNRFNYDPTGTSSEIAFYRGNNANDGFITFATNTSVTSGTAAVERMRISAAGTVGINTGSATPADQLEVVGNIRTTSITAGGYGVFGPASSTGGASIEGYQNGTQAFIDLDAFPATSADESIIRMFRGSTGTSLNSGFYIYSPGTTTNTFKVLAASGNVTTVGTINAGGTITGTSLTGSINAFAVADANTERNPGLLLLTNTTGSTNFQSTAGLAIEARRSSSGSSSDLGTFQIYSSSASANTDLYFRKITTWTSGTPNVETWSAWQKVLTDLNHSSVIGGTYVAKAGDTMTGPLDIRVDQNASTDLYATNITSGTAARAGIYARSGATVADSIGMLAVSAGYTAIAGWADSGIINTASGLSGGLVLNADSASTGIRFQIGTSEKMRINSTGQVMIGATGPVIAAKFTVADSANALTSLAAFANSNAGTTAQSLVAVTSDVSSLHIGSNSSTYAGGSSYGDASEAFIRASATSTGLHLISSQAAMPMRFSTAAVERMRIDGAGLIGIGMTPAQALDVTKSGNALSAIQITNAHTGTSADARLVASNGTDTAGLVMRGTGNTLAGTAALFVSGANALTFYTNGSERARIDSAGLFGVGGGSSTLARPIELFSSTRAIYRATSTATVGTDVLSGMELMSYDGTAVTQGAVLYHHSSTHSPDPSGVFLNVIRNAPLVLLTNNTERLRIDGAGAMTVAQDTTFGGHITLTRSGNTTIARNSTAGYLSISGGNGINDGPNIQLGGSTSATFTNLMVFRNGTNNLGVFTSGGSLVISPSATAPTGSEKLLVSTTSNGASATLAVLQNLGNLVGTGVSLNFATATNGGAGVTLGGINVVATGAVTTGNATGDMAFSTTSAAAASEKMRITGVGLVMLGSASDLAPRAIEVAGGSTAGSINALNIETSTANQYSGITIVRNDNVSATLGASINLARTNGASDGAVTLVTTGMTLGGIAFSGADGTDIRTKAAEIVGVCEGTVGANIMPGRLVFSTTAAGAAEPTERLRIDSTGLATFTGNVIGATPTLTTHLATKGYVDNAILGLSWKAPARAATTANITLSAPQTIDGIAVIAGDRVLVKNQTTASQNGVYIVAAAAWVRATDFDSVSPLDEVNSAALMVEEGTTNADTCWTQTAAITTVGTDAMAFTQFMTIAALQAGAGLVVSGNGVAVGTASTARIVVNADNIDLATVTQDVLTTGKTFSKIVLDAYGRVAGNTPVVAADVAGALGTSALTPSSVTIDSVALLDTATTAVTTTTATTIASFTAAAYRTAKFLVQVTDTTNSQYHAVEILVIHNGTTVFKTEYAEVSTNGALGTFDASITTGTLNLQFTATAATTKSVKVYATSLTV